MIRTTALTLGIAMSLAIGLSLASSTSAHACLNGGFPAGPGWFKGSDGCWHPPLSPGSRHNAGSKVGPVRNANGTLNPSAKPTKE